MENLNIAGQFYSFEEGNVYAIMTNITRIDKIIEKENIEAFSENKYFSLDGSILYNRGILYYLGMSHKYRKTVNLLRNYNFSKDEAEQVIHDFEINAKTKYLVIREINMMILNVLLKNNRIIIFDTITLSYVDTQLCCQYLFDNVRHSNKIGLIVEYSEAPFDIVQIDQNIIDNYIEWINPYNLNNKLTYIINEFIDIMNQFIDNSKPK